jgi:hypothetical protein
MLEFMKLIGEIHPGIFIHSVYIHEDLNEDRKAGFVRPISTSAVRSRANYIPSVWQYR